MVGVGAVRTVVAVPGVLVGAVAIHRSSASVINVQFPFDAVFDTYDDETVVVAVPVGGEHVGDFNLGGLLPIHLFGVQILQGRVLLLLSSDGGLRQGDGGDNRRCDRRARHGGLC